MAIARSRDEMVNWCLRALGAPVIEINVAEEQIDDRVDEAIDFWQKYNSEASYRTYVKVKITQEILDTNEIKLDPAILSVVQVLPFGMGSNNVFSTKTQAFLELFTSLRPNASQGQGLDLVSFEIMKETMETANDLINGHGHSLMFNRHMSQLKFNVPLKETLSVGEYIILESYMLINPEEYPNIYNDASIKEHLTLLIKKQWGMNMMKFEGMTLPGGITVNGRQMYDDAVADLTEFKAGYALRYEEPASFFMG